MAASCDKPQFIRCLLCECNTIEQALAAHIQFNHMIYKEAVQQVIFNLHYPPLKDLLLDELIEMAEEEANKKNESNEQIFTPFQQHMCEESRSKGTGEKRKRENNFQNSRLNSEDLPKSKKPKNSTKATPIKKKREPTVNEMSDDEQILTRKKKKKGTNVAHTEKKTSEKQSISIQRMRELQENELQCIMDQGTYVQRCDCNKWRLVKEFEDPSLVPEYWVCSMNKDKEANDCNKGDGDDVESDEEFVSVDFTCGSMVWVKFAGYPWWPGMVDICPDVEDSFIVNAVNPNEAAEYHVVFFDKANNIARAWTKKDLVIKMLDTEDPPKPPVFKSDSINKRYLHAKDMAMDALNLPLIERIEKYSFASLYTGKWGELADNTKDLDIERTSKREAQRNLKKNKKSIGVKKQFPKKQLQRKEEYDYLEFVQNGEKLNKISENEETRKSRSRRRNTRNTDEGKENKGKEMNDDNISVLSPTREATPENEDSPASNINDELLNEILDYSSDEDETIETDRRAEGHENNIEQSKNPSNIMKLIDETDTLDKDKNEKHPKDGKPSKYSKKSPRKNGAIKSLNMENDDNEYGKPPMSPQLLLAIAVTNLDPHKDAGASCTDIVAFLSNHFPYYSDHYQECMDMVRQESGVSFGENFQMKAQIHCGDRIHTYVKNNREKICHSMLEPEFLDIIIERFVNQHSMVSPKSKKTPPFDKKMLTHIALLKIQKRATLEQLVIFLKFIFPALALPGVMETYRKEFLEEIAKSKELDTKVDNNNITFALNEDLKEDVIDQIRACSLENLDTVGKSLLNESLFDAVLPIFQNN